MPFTICNNSSYRPPCPVCGKKMFTITDYQKSLCNFQYGIDESLLCIDCDVKEERQAEIRGVLSYPSGPSCKGCQRHGFYGCLIAEVEKSSYSDDSCYSSGEQQLDQRLDCSCLGEAHP